MDHLHHCCNHACLQNHPQERWTNRFWYYKVQFVLLSNSISRTHCGYCGPNELMKLDEWRNVLKTQQQVQIILPPCYLWCLPMESPIKYYISVASTDQPSIPVPKLVTCKLQQRVRRGAPVIVAAGSEVPEIFQRNKHIRGYPTFSKYPLLKSYKIGLSIWRSPHTHTHKFSLNTTKCWL